MAEQFRGAFDTPLYDPAIGDLVKSPRFAGQVQEVVGFRLSVRGQAQVLIKCEEGDPWAWRGTLVTMGGIPTDGWYAWVPAMEFALIRSGVDIHSDPLRGGRR